MTDRLLPARARLPAVLAIAVCAGVVTALGVHYAGDSAAGRLDRGLDDHITNWLGDEGGLLDRMVMLADAQTVVAWCLLLALLSTFLGRPRGVVLSVTAPAVAGGLTTFVLKPVIDRELGGTWVLPSGHTTGAFAVAFVCLVLLVPGARRRIGVPLRVLLGALALVLALSVAAAVVALRYHYTTDAIAGICVALAVVVLAAMTIDALADRGLLQSPARLRNRS